MANVQLGEGGFNLSNLEDNRATCYWYKLAYTFTQDSSYRWWMQVFVAGRISDPLPCVIDDFGTLVQVIA